MVYQTATMSASLTMDRKIAGTIKLETDISVSSDVATVHSASCSVVSEIRGHYCLSQNLRNQRHETTLYMSQYEANKLSLAFNIWKTFIASNPEPLLPNLDSHILQQRGT